MLFTFYNFINHWHFFINQKFLVYSFLNNNINIDDSILDLYYYGYNLGVRVLFSYNCKGITLYEKFIEGSSIWNLELFFMVFIFMILFYFIIGNRKNIYILVCSTVFLIMFSLYYSIFFVGSKISNFINTISNTLKESFIIKIIPENFLFVTDEIETSNNNLESVLEYNTDDEDFYKWLDFWYFILNPLDILNNFSDDDVMSIFDFIYQTNMLKRIEDNNEYKLCSTFDVEKIDFITKDLNTEFYAWYFENALILENFFNLEQNDLENFYYYLNLYNISFNEFIYLYITEEDPFFYIETNTLDFFNDINGNFNMEFYLWYTENISLLDNLFEKIELESLYQYLINHNLTLNEFLFIEEVDVNYNIQDKYDYFHDLDDPDDIDFDFYLWYCKNLDVLNLNNFIKKDEIKSLYKYLTDNELNLNEFFYGSLDENDLNESFDLEFLIWYFENSNILNEYFEQNEMESLYHYLINNDITLDTFVYNIFENNDYVIDINGDFDIDYIVWYFANFNTLNNFFEENDFGYIYDYLIDNNLDLYKFIYFYDSIDLFENNDIYEENNFALEFLIWYFENSNILNKYFEQDQMESLYHYLINNDITLDTFVYFYNNENNNENNNDNEEYFFDKNDIALYFWHEKNKDILLDLFFLRELNLMHDFLTNDDIDIYSFDLYSTYLREHLDIDINNDYVDKKYFSLDYDSWYDFNIELIDEIKVYNLLNTIISEMDYDVEYLLSVITSVNNFSYTDISDITELYYSVNHQKYVNLIDDTLENFSDLDLFFLIGLIKELQINSIVDNIVEKQQHYKLYNEDSFVFFNKETFPTNSIDKNEFNLDFIKYIMQNIFDFVKNVYFFFINFFKNYYEEAIALNEFFPWEFSLRYKRDYNCTKSCPVHCFDNMSFHANIDCEHKKTLINNENTIPDADVAILTKVPSKTDNLESIVNKNSLLFIENDFISFMSSFDFIDFWEILLSFSFLNNLFIMDAYSLIIKIILIFFLSFFNIILIFYIYSPNKSGIIYSEKTKKNFIATKQNIINIKFLRNFFFIIFVTVFFLLNLISAYSLLSLFVCVEGTTLCLYILAGLKSNNRLSTEAGVKYFAMSSIFSCIFGMGIFLLYLITNSIDFANINEIIYFMSNIVVYYNNLSYILNISILLIIIVFLMKLGSAPYHFWIGDIYQGSPLLVTSFFATIVRLAFFAVFFRLICFVFYFNFNFSLCNILYFFGGVSIIIGSFCSLNQSELKKFLAYSSIVHTGFILIGLSTLTMEGFKATFIYLIVYLFTLLSFFFIVLLSYTIFQYYKKNIKNFYIRDFKYLSDLSTLPISVKILITFLLFSMAGLPPLPGFLIKFYIFIAVANQLFFNMKYHLEIGFLHLSNYFVLYFFLIIILLSFLTAYNYIRFIPKMLFATQQHVNSVKDIFNVTRFFNPNKLFFRELYFSIVRFLLIIHSFLIVFVGKTFNTNFDFLNSIWGFSHNHNIRFI